MTFSGILDHSADLNTDKKMGMVMENVKTRFLIP